jgi:hypothetical protein
MTYSEQPQALEMWGLQNHCEVMAGEQNEDPHLHNSLWWYGYTAEVNQAAVERPYYGHWGPNPHEVEHMI